MNLCVQRRNKDVIARGERRSLLFPVTSFPVLARNNLHLGRIDGFVAFHLEDGVFDDKSPNFVT